MTGRIRILRSSAFDLGLEDGVVGNIFCIRFLHHIGSSQSRIRLLNELHRVTRSTLIVSLWVDGNIKAWRRRLLEQNRSARPCQNRFVISRCVIEQEFETANFKIIGAVDFLPRYAMWRTYVLKKR